VNFPDRRNGILISPQILYRGEAGAHRATSARSDTLSSNAGLKGAGVVPEADAEPSHDANQSTGPLPEFQRISSMGSVHSSQDVNHRGSCTHGVADLGEEAGRHYRGHEGGCHSSEDEGRWLSLRLAQAHFFSAIGDGYACVHDT
jgi:hypothetical protein